MSVVTLPSGEKCYTWPNCSRHNTKPVSLADLRTEFNKRLDDFDKGAVKFTPLAKQQPAEIDGSLAELYDQLYMNQDNLSRAHTYIKSYGQYVASEVRKAEQYEARAAEGGEEAERFSRMAAGFRAGAARYQESVDSYHRDAEAAESKIRDIKAEIEPFEAEYARRGRWTRAFLVTNGNGHVHKTMGCSTCRPTTRFAWLTDYSAHKEAEIVGDAGERACTVCYPSAPVDVLARATKIFTPDEKAKQAKRAEQEAKRAAKKAKAVTDEAGNVLEYRMFGDRTGGYSQPLNSEVTARSALVEIRENQLVRERKPGRLNDDPDKLAVWQEDFTAISVALARKLGVSLDELRADIENRAEKKYNSSGWSRW